MKRYLKQTFLKYQKICEWLMSKYNCPMKQTSLAYQPCVTPKGSDGHCRRMQNCDFAEVRSNFWLVLGYLCMIENSYVSKLHLTIISCYSFVSSTKFLVLIAVALAFAVRTQSTWKPRWRRCNVTTTMHPFGDQMVASKAPANSRYLNPKNEVIRNHN